MFMIVAPNGSAEPVAYRIDRDATRVEFVAHALGIIEARGRFTDVRGMIVLDREIARGDIEFEIDARSVDSGWTLRDSFVRGEPMLDATRYPMIRFTSSHLTFTEGRLKDVHGMLTVRGVTRSIVLSVIEIACDAPASAATADCEARAVAHLNRGTYGMESFAPFVSDDVELRFVVVAHRTAEAITSK